MIKSVQMPSFKGYVPVEFYAKNPANGNYVPVLKRENIKRCQGFVVRNLNGTAKNTKDQGFVDFYKKYDKDYARVPAVHSVYDHENPIVYMITGSDVDNVREMAKPIGKAKSGAIDTLGHTSSFEVFQAGRDYYRNVQNFIKNNCSRLKADDKSPLTLRVYFNPLYGKRNQFKGFEFAHARFIKDEKR